MGISTTTNRVGYSGNGTTTTFGFAFYFALTTDLLVYTYDTVTGTALLQALNTDYTVTGTQNAQGIYSNGGSVVMTVAPTTGQQLGIIRNPVFTQGYSLLQNGQISSAALVQELDYLTLLVQRLEDQVSRAAILPDGMGASFSTLLPAAIALAASQNRVLIINAAGTGFDIGPNASTIEGAAAASAAAVAAAASAAGSVISANAFAAQALGFDVDASVQASVASAASGTAIAAAAQAIAASARISAGVPGLDGVDGLDGSDGPPGIAGAAGVAGSAGPSGAMGFGIDGVDGQDGNDGPLGPQGLVGPQGPQGPVGFGMDGQEGDAGLPGVGLPGAQGIQGFPGVSQLIFLPGDDAEPGERGPPGPAQPITFASTAIPPTIQTFLSGSGTYTTPPNCIYISVRMVGGGGGGGGCSSVASSAGSGGGGGAGGTLIALIQNPAPTYSYVVGAGGAGGVAGANNGSAGTNSTFNGAVYTATGGNPGGGGVATTITTALWNGTGGTGGIPTGGYENITGGAGSYGLNLNNSNALGGAGGDSEFGPGAISGIANSTGAVGGIGGGGGGGTQNNAGPAQAGGAGGPGYIEVTQYFASSAPYSNPVNPTIQTFATAGSFTYTLPISPVTPSYIRVRMTGGGGGGAGSGTAPGAAGAGGNSTFGTSLLVANGGGAGPAGAGGTASLGTGPIGTVMTGGAGGNQDGAVANATGGSGGNTPFGGIGPGGTAGNPGVAAAANTGSGGGGAGNLAVGASGGGGGGAGFVDALIVNPLASYPIVVGAFGTAGTAGTSGFGAGAGSLGYIEVTEYYPPVGPVGPQGPAGPAIFLLGDEGPENSPIMPPQQGQVWKFLGTASGSGVTVGPVVWFENYSFFFFSYVITGYAGGSPIGRFLIGPGAPSTTGLTNGNKIIEDVTVNATSVSVPGMPLAATSSNIARSGWGHILGNSGALKQIASCGMNGNPSAATSPISLIGRSFFSDLSTNLPIKQAQLTVYDTLIATAASATAFTANTQLWIWGLANTP